MQNWCLHQNTYVLSPIWFKGQHRLEEKKNPRRPEVLILPGSDIESQDLFYNVWPGHGQARLIILKYFARSNIQMRYTDPTT